MPVTLIPVTPNKRESKAIILCSPAVPARFWYLHAFGICTSDGWFVDGWYQLPQLPIWDAIGGGYSDGAWHRLGAPFER